MPARLALLAVLVAVGCTHQPPGTDGGVDGGSGLGCPHCTVFVNGLIFDGTDAGPGVMVIEGARITDVVFGSPPIGEGTVVDLTGKTLLPGLIDAHTHLFVAAGPRGWSAPNSLIDAHLKAFLRSGVTTILDLGSPAAEIFAYRARIRSGALLGPNLLAAGPLLTPTGGHPCYSGTVVGDFCGLVDQPTEVGSVMAQLLPLHPDVIKLVLDPGVGGNPLPELSGASTLAIRMAAQDAGLIAIAHVFDNAGVQTALAEGITSLAHVPAYDLMTADVAAAVADAGCTVIPTLSFSAGYVAMSTQTGPWVGGAGPVDDVPSEVLAALGNPADLGPYTGFLYQRAFERWQTNQQQNFRLERDAGVRFVAGTDCGNAADFHGLSLAQELAAYAGLGMTPLEALESATSVSADWLGHPELGHLRAGARADLLVVDGDPTVDVSALTRVDRVYKDGVLLDRAALSVQSGQSLVKVPVTGLDAGSYCLELGECAPGLVCPMSFQHCSQPCDGGACPLGSFCEPDSAGGPSYCYVGDGCNPLTQNCPNAAACFFLGNAVSACANAGGAQAGQPCNAGCARGTECMEPSNVCRGICDPTSDAGCTSPQACIGEEALAGLPVGVCE